MKPPYLSKFTPYMVATLIATAAGVVIYFFVRAELSITLESDDIAKRLTLSNWIIISISFGYLYTLFAAWPCVELTKRIANNITRNHTRTWVYAGAIIGVAITALFNVILMVVSCDFEPPRIIDVIALFSYGVGGAIGGAIYVRSKNLLAG